MFFERHFSKLFNMYKFIATYSIKTYPFIVPKMTIRMTMMMVMMMMMTTLIEHDNDDISKLSR